MWQRFTERARKTIFYAQEEAQKFGEGYVSTEHILLGLLREHDSVACGVLHGMAVSVRRVQAEVEKHLVPQKSRPSQDMTLTPRAKRVIDLAYDEARNLNNNYIGTEHLLLGLIREGDGVAGKVLATLGVEIEVARCVVIELQESKAVDKTGPSLAAGVPRRPAERSGHSSNPTPYFHIRQGRYVAEHLFLMLVADPESDSAKVVRALPNVRGLQLEVESFMLSLGVHETAESGPEVLQHILDRAAEEAKALGHSKVLLRHLLIALAFEENSFIHKPLKEKLEELRQAAKDLPE